MDNIPLDPFSSEYKAYTWTVAEELRLHLEDATSYTLPTGKSWFQPAQVAVWEPIRTAILDRLDGTDHTTPPTPGTPLLLPDSLKKDLLSSLETTLDGLLDY